jgi:probable phosphoglycerate mutase
MRPLEVYLVRHGQTEWNASGRFQGKLDSPLTARGISQAEAAGRKVASFEHVIDAVLVSPPGRARQTSAIIRSMSNLPPEQVDERLREVSIGSWDGLTQTDIDACWPGLLDGATSFDWYFRSPDGERYEDAAGRAEEWLAHSGATVLAITHGLMSRIIRGAYLGLSKAEALELAVDQGAIWRLADGSITTL